MIDYVEKILKSPDAVRQAKSLNLALQKEQKKRHEFREWITPDVKAEFVNGEVILHSPVKKRHWYALDLLSSILSVYVRSNKLGKVGIEKVMIGLTRNDYEPDLVFFNKPVADEFIEDQMIFPAPDFVVEILSKKTIPVDRGIKKRDYAAHGVKEYWIIDPTKKQIEQNLLINDDDTEYFPASIFDIESIIESKVIKGFKVPVEAIFDDEANLKAMNALMKKKRK